MPMAEEGGRPSWDAAGAITRQWRGFRKGTAHSDLSDIRDTVMTMAGGTSLTPPSPLHLTHASPEIREANTQPTQLSLLGNSSPFSDQGKKDQSRT